MIEEQNKEVKKVTLGLILGWGLGVLVAISGITLLFSQPITGVLLLLLAIVLLPPANKFVADKFNFSISGGLKFILIVVLLGIIGASMGTSDSSAPEQDIEAGPTAMDQPSEKPSEKSGDQQVQSPPQPTSPPQQVAPSKSYVQVFTFSGNGAKKSEPFTIQGNRFKIAYNCDGDPDFTICQAFAYKINSSFPELVMNTSEPTNDETVIYGRGDYYIDANIIGDFTMTVYDYR